MILRQEAVTVQLFLHRGKRAISQQVTAALINPPYAEPSHAAECETTSRAPCRHACKTLNCELCHLRHHPTLERVTQDGRADAQHALLLSSAHTLRRFSCLQLTQRRRLVLLSTFTTSMCGFSVALRLTVLRASVPLRFLPFS